MLKVKVQDEKSAGVGKTKTLSLVIENWFVQSKKERFCGQNQSDGKNKITDEKSKGLVGWFYGITTLIGLFFAGVSIEVVVSSYISYKKESLSSF